MKRILTTILVLGLFVPSLASAATPELQAIYNARADLQQAFDKDTHQAIPNSAAGFLIDLEDWARQYGWQSYVELASYAPLVTPPVPGGVTTPEVTASHYIVLDKASGTILAAHRADEVWPIASITKLMTAQVAYENGVDFESMGDVRNIDNVGGARLWVEDGTTFSMYHLFSAMLIASANNAATAIARLVDPVGFVAQMNAKAQALNLGRTTFADPSGIDENNTSTAREVAYMVTDILKTEDIRRLTATSYKYIHAVSDDEWRKVKNSNWMLYYPEYDDVYVTGGKTGYLDESGWNLVVHMRPSWADKNKELILVTFGSSSRAESFQDTEALAKWAWHSFNWNREFQTATE